MSTETCPPKPWETSRPRYRLGISIIRERTDVTGSGPRLHQHPYGETFYYFRDKVELIIYCVKLYKTECVTRYNRIVETTETAEGLRQAFGEAMAGTLRENARLHRLWYDLRNQSLFEKAIRTDVLAIDQTLERAFWRIFSRYAEPGGRSPEMAPLTVYALFDGLFQQDLLRHLAGQDDAARHLQESVEQVLDRITT